MCTFIVVSKCCKSFNMFSYIQGEKIRTGKLWMKCVTPEQMKARAGKITFCGKHKHHSKTLREIQRLKQDENALKISRGTHLCYNVNLFFLEKISSMLLCLARGKINIHTNKCARLFKSPNDIKVLTCWTVMKPCSQNRGEKLCTTTRVLLSAN